MGPVVDSHVELTPRIAPVNYSLAESAPGDASGVNLPPGGSLFTQVVMKGEPLQRTVTIHNPQGFHMRPASLFAKRANQFQSSVVIRRDNLCVNGKSLMDLILLAAELGSQLTLEVAGEDAESAINALAELIEAELPDGDDDGASPPPKG